MKRSSGVLASILIGLAAPVQAFCGDLSVPSPLTFDAVDNGNSSYSLNWTMRLGEAVPVNTRVKVGLAGAGDGRVTELPLRVTTGIGSQDETALVRRSIEVTAGQTANRGDASVSVRRARQISIAPGLDAELRQTVTTGLSSDPNRSVGVLRTSQTLVVYEFAPKTSLQATTTLSSDQRGPSAQLRIERKLLTDFRVSADFTHNANTNGARIDARYFLSW